MFVFDFDGPVADLDGPVVDLDAHLQAQFGLGVPVESMPLFTERVGDVALAVIRVTHDGRTRHQVYAIAQGTWALVAIFGLYTDAMSELLRWRRYLDGGGTVAAWQLTHQDGIYPEHSGLPLRGH
jgi:hypothetical protein